MKKAWKHLIIGLVTLLLLLGALVSLVIWALNTPEGTRALFRAVSVISPIRLDAQEISGRLRDELKIKGLRVRWPQGELRADSFHLRWQAAELWNRKLIIQELSLDGAGIQDLRPGTEKISVPGWPEIPFWLTKVQGRLDSLRIQRTVYQRPKEEALSIDHLSTRLRWDGEVLSVEDFILHSSAYQAEGSMTAGFSRPFLTLNLRASLAKEIFGVDSVLIKLGLEPAETREEAKGALLVSGKRKAAEKIHLEGTLGLTRSALKFQNLRLHQPDRKGGIQGEGEIAFSENPIFYLKANFSDLEFHPDLGLVKGLSGKLEAKGPLNKYKGQVTIANQAKGWQKARAVGSFRGNLESLEFTDLDGRWLDGSVIGPLKISWADGIFLEGRIHGRKLNLARFNPDLKGEINLNLEGKFRWVEAQGPEATFKANLLKSLLLGKTVAGDLEGSWKKDLLKAAHLRLRGQGFDLRGEGILQDKLAIEGQVTDLSQLISGAKGQLSARGWLRYQEGRLTGGMDVEAKNLEIPRLKTDHLNVQVRLKEYTPKALPVISMDARLVNLQAGSVLIESANLQADGTPASHRAQVGMNWKGGEIQGDLAGSYQNGSWKGTLDKLTGREARSHWTLLAPARVTLSDHQFQLSPLSIRSSQGEEIQAQADLDLDPILGYVQAQWQNLDLARAHPWLSQGILSGESSGSLTARWSKSGPQLSAKGKFRAAFSYDQLKLEVPTGQAKFAWSEKGLQASADLKLNQEGVFEARISSPEPFQLEAPKEGKFQVQWKAIDLGPLQPFFPSNLALKGKNSGNLSGGWFPGSRLEASGNIKVSQGLFIWKGTPKPISVKLNPANMDFSWKEDQIQAHLAIGSPDYGSIQGDFLVPLSCRFSPSILPDGPLKVSLQGELQEKGLLAVLYPGWIQTSRGKLGLEVKGEGTWNKPRMKGSLRISDAGLEISREGLPQKEGPAASPLVLKVSSGHVAGDWTGQGLLASLHFVFPNGGRIEGTLSSSESARFSIPRQGKADLVWTAFEVSALQPLLPQGFSLEGQAGGQFRGQWLPDLRFDMTGRLNLAGGKLTWRGEKGLIHAPINQAEMDFLWRGEWVQGNASLSLADYGSLKGTFRLPLPAHPPFGFNSAGPIQVSLRGQAQEKGLLSAFFPGMVEETRGAIDLDFKAGGTWGSPNLQGTLRLRNARAYLPSLGIRVEDISSRCRFLNGQIQVEAFQARSGPGQIEGTGRIWLKGWDIDHFEGTLKGEKFQTIYLPNLHIQSSPSLQFQGHPEHLSVRGEILLPQVQIYEVSAPGVARTSSDVVIVDQSPERKPPLSLDIQVRVVLGDRIEVKAGGMDARLAGNLDLKISGLKPKDATARGEIRLTQGTYGGYGLALRIDRGRFIYSGGPVDNPDLDILALRRSDDLEKMYGIKVGLAVFGNLKNPNVKLYSQPAMKDEEILSYLLLGRPYDPKEGNLSLLLAGAGGLLAGDSPGVVDQLKSQLGIDTVDIQSGSGDLSRSMVAIGKYLTPQLYVSYGYSVLSDEQILKIRYRISKNWEVETWRGNAMGIDLYYRIDFY